MSLIRRHSLWWHQNSNPNKVQWPISKLHACCGSYDVFLEHYHHNNFHGSMFTHNQFQWLNWDETCVFRPVPWWRHQMETFPALVALCAGKSPVTKASDAELWCFLWSAMASQITSLKIGYSTVISGADKKSKPYVTGICDGNSSV